jgi:transcriptional regulator with XRE-family HTH domain
MAPVERVAMRIKEWRKRRKLSQEELAEKAGISRGYLARLETARQDPKLSTLEKVARALKIDVTKLLK